jgi:hypothetical protein
MTCAEPEPEPEVIALPDAEGELGVAARSADGVLGVALLLSGDGALGVAAGGLAGRSAGVLLCATAAPIMRPLRAVVIMSFFNIVESPWIRLETQTPLV